MDKKILIIDGHSMLHRAFYAVPDLTNSRGEHTGAVYGFLNILFKVLDQEKPACLVVAFDEHAPTFRHEIYAEYKGNRKPMPEELKCQVGLLRQVLEAMGIVMVSKAGLEADDLIGTLSVRAEKKGFEVAILSGDRDLLQLVTEKVKLILPRTAKGETRIDSFYPEDVIREYHVPPRGIIELKALMGDPSDNIPGVPKIGEKTATALLMEYGNIDELEKHIADISKKSIRTSLEEHFDMARLSHTLASINTDAPFELEPESAELGNIFTREAWEVFRKLELKSFYRYFDEGLSREDTDPSAAEYVFRQITDADEADRVVSAALSGNDSCCFAVDTASFLARREEEKNGKKPGKRAEGFHEEQLAAIAIIAGGNSVYIKLEEENLRALLSKLLGEGGPERFTVSSKLLRSFTGTDFAGNVTDVELAMYLADPARSSYNVPEDARKAAVFARVNSDSCLERLDEKERRILYDIEMPLSQVLSDMEAEGILVEPAMLEEFSLWLGEQIEKLEEKIYAEAGEQFNINSPKQLGAVLFEKLMLPGAKKTKTGYTTSAEVLEKLEGSFPIAGHVLEYRTLTKLKATYADGLRPFIGKDGRIRSTFNQTITATGRISSAEPNLQNIPVRTEMGRKLRQAFVPKEGYCFVDADYSQIELRILASLSGDEKLIEAYRQEKDIHAITASEVFHVPFEEVTAQLRRNAKAVNFGIVYGISSFGLSRDLSISVKEAGEYIRKYFETYPGVKRYLDSLVESAKKTGCAVTLFGRKRPVTELKSSNFAQRGFGERVAMNAPIQGTAADIIKIAMIRVHRALREEGLRSKLLLQVHDELLVETAMDEKERVEEILRREMMGAAELAVPLEVETMSGMNWDEAH